MADMTNVTKFFPVAKEGFTTTVATTVNPGDATVQLNSVSGYANGDVVVLVVDATDPLKKQVFTGMVDTGGVQITNVKWTEGANTTHLAGASVVDYVTATHQSMTTKGNLVTHNQDGTLKNKIVKTANIDDQAVDTAQIKNSAVDTAQIKDGAVTPLKLSLGGATKQVSTQESSSSTSYVDLTTVCSVTVTVNTQALVFIGASNSNNTSAAYTWISFAVSGANTIAASDTNGMMQLINPAPTGLLTGASKVVLLTDLTPGSTTFTMKYKVSTGTGFWRDRYITVLPIG